MAYPMSTVPDPPPGSRASDPLAVAVGNASLLGVGYLMLRQRWLALANVVVTLTLVLVLALAAQSVWFEAVVLVWWAAVIAHGWYLAGRRSQSVAVRRPWTIALSAALPVLLAAGLLRFDVSQTEGIVAGGHASGDCARVLSAQHGVWLGDRIADSPLAARGDKTVAACRRLEAAEARLTAGLTGDTASLESGFGTLNSLLANPGNEKMVEVALNGFFGSLPTKNSCQTAAVTDWLRGRRPTRNVLDRSAGVVARVAPAALVACGDDLMAARDWNGARSRYQQLLDQYPGDERAARARAGARHATLSIELANVRRLLAGPSGEQPRYCSAPARYEAAPPYRGGASRALFYGDVNYTSQLPGGWKAHGDIARAGLVVCAGGRHHGSSVETCPYTSTGSSSGSLGNFPTDVTFHKIAIPVKAYALRTGRRVFDGTVQISGTSCPPTISYTSYGVDIGPPSDEYVHPSTADVRAAFGSVVGR